tara:strand:- start:671 stop:1048 length:378 start_codon:yes stop_codon:yes gene_type:complete
MQEMGTREYTGILPPIIHGEWVAAYTALEELIEHKKIAPLATEVPRWQDSEKDPKDWKLNVSATSRLFRPLLEGELSGLVAQDSVLQAGYEAVCYFTDRPSWPTDALPQRTKPRSYRNLGSNFGH